MRCLNDGSQTALREDELFAQASAIKVPILWDLYHQADQGGLALDELISIEPTNGAGGCGVLQEFRAGVSQVCLADLAVLMIALSDNVATNLLIDRLGMESVNRLLESLGCEQTRLRRKMIDLEARAAGRENTSTAAEAVGLMADLYVRSKSDDGVANSVRRTLSIKKESPFYDALHRHARVESKPGALKGLRTEWGIVTRGESAYCFAVMGEGDDETLKQAFIVTAQRIDEAYGGR